MIRKALPMQCVRGALCSEEGESYEAERKGEKAQNRYSCFGCNNGQADTERCYGENLC